MRYGGTPRGNMHVDTANKTMDKGSWSDQRCLGQEDHSGP